MGYDNIFGLAIILLNTVRNHTIPTHTMVNHEIGKHLMKKFQVETLKFHQEWLDQMFWPLHVSNLNPQPQ